MPHKREIGLAGAIATIIGFVIGASIFILPGTLAGIAGPAVLLSYAIAGFVALLACLVAASLGSIFPVQGASYVAVSRTISSTSGFLMISLILVASILANSFLALGFADYFRVYFPSFDRIYIAVSVLLLFGILNLINSQLVIRVQSLLVVLFMLAIIVFSISGITHIERDNLVPFMPNGINSIFYAAMAGYFSFSGFVFLLEIGGEIKRPSRNIPAALGISFIIVLAAYASVSLSLVGTVNWRELADLSAPVTVAAGRMLPAWVADGITLTILAAAATSINGLLLIFPRDFAALAKAGMFPAVFSRGSSKHGHPVPAIILYTTLCIIAVLWGRTLAEYASMAVLATMLQQILLSVSLWRIHTKKTAETFSADFQLPKYTVLPVTLGLGLVSSGFAVFSLFQNISAFLLVAACLIFGVFYYHLRLKYMHSKGINVEERLVELAIPKYEVI
jgi:APA family basic amino acid/polyamine antiporter